MKMKFRVGEEVILRPLSINDMGKVLRRYKHIAVKLQPYVGKIVTVKSVHTDYYEIYYQLREVPGALVAESGLQKIYGEKINKKLYGNVPCDQSFKDDFAEMIKKINKERVS
jgi:hypothetical protein